MQEHAIFRYAHHVVWFDFVTCVVCVRLALRLVARRMFDSRENVVAKENKP